MNEPERTHHEGECFVDEQGGLCPECRAWLC